MASLTPPTLSSSVMTTFGAHSLNCLLASPGVKAGFMLEVTKPALDEPPISTGYSGQFGKNRTTTSPGFSPRSWNALAILSDSDRPSANVYFLPVMASSYLLFNNEYFCFFGQFIITYYCRPVWPLHACLSVPHLLVQRSCHQVQVWRRGAHYIVRVDF